MKTRIKKIEHSDGRVEYIPQIKKFGYEIGGYSGEVFIVDWWFYLIPVIGQIALFLLPTTLLWQSYDIICDDESVARGKLDKALKEYNNLIQKRVRITKKVEYIKHP